MSSVCGSGQVGVSHDTRKEFFFFFFKTHHYTRAVEKQEMDYLMVFDHRDKIKPQVDEGVHCNPERTLNFQKSRK